MNQKKLDVLFIKYELLFLFDKPTINELNKFTNSNFKCTDFKFNEHNVLLSYPRSGNHLVRFLIEYFTKFPTKGCKENKLDVPIYQNIFPDNFKINIKNTELFIYNKYHKLNFSRKVNNLIIIVRPPEEVLIRNILSKKTDKIDINIFKNISLDNFTKNINKTINIYNNIIKFYLNFNGNKLCLLYNDLINKKFLSINRLCCFLGISNDKSTIEIENLYNISINGKNRKWGQKNSNSTNFYYKILSEKQKEKFNIIANESKILYNKLIKNLENHTYNFYLVEKINYNYKIIIRKYIKSLKIAHLINPFNCSEDNPSYLYYAQPITFKSMRNAQLEANEEGIDVKLYAVNYPEDDKIIPEYFIKLPHLKKSTMTEFPKESGNRKLPIIQEMFDSILQNSDADYIIFTNSDIGLQKHFYKEVYKKIVNDNLKSFVINRRDDIPKFKNGIRLTEQNLDLIYKEKGKKHPGKDCFIIERKILKKIDMNLMFTGFGGWGKTLVDLMKKLDKKSIVFTEEYLTFHLGADLAWNKDKKNKLKLKNLELKKIIYDIKNI